MTAAARAVVVAATAALATACHRTPPADTQPKVAASTVPASAPPPVDHLAPDELLEGTDHAFGLTLPRNLEVAHSFVSVIDADGPLALHPVVKYFRARLDGGAVREGDAEATFEHVSVRGKPGVELAIHVWTAPGGVHVEVRDTTPGPPPNLPDEAARWKHVGLTPNGRVVDPTHLD
jgi:hypothetical protein